MSSGDNCDTDGIGTNEGDGDGNECGSGDDNDGSEEGDGLDGDHDCDIVEFKKFNILKVSTK